MPFVTHVYREPVFQMVGVAGCPKLQASITKAKSGDNTGSYRASITVSQSFSKIQEYYLTKRELWYFDQTSWDVSKLQLVVLDFYIQYELNSTTAQILEKVEASSGQKFRNHVLLKISVHKFSEKSEHETDMEVSVTVFQ